MKIESKDIDIESLLDGAYFHIPRFQRPYSWDEENLGDFWHDVVTSGSTDYFIGSMVVFKTAKQQFGVVDGQQRLTTITILLCVIRDALADLNEDDLAWGIHQLIERKDRTNKDEFVLKTESSFPFFQENIQKFGSSEDLDFQVETEEENLKLADVKFQKYLEAELQSIDEDPSIGGNDKIDRKIKRLCDIRDCVLNLNLILITLDNEDDAYLIFETLNTRGKDLSLTDLLKNHFFKHMKNKGEVDHAKERWNSLLETIYNSNEDISSDNFIYHFWCSRYDAIPAKKLFPVMKKEINKKEANAYLKFLADDSKLYRAIHETGYMWDKNEKDIAESLAALRLFKLQQPIPATLSLVRAYKAGIIRNKTLRNVLSAIENFHFVFTAVTSSRSSGGISAMYSAFAQRLFNCQNSQQAADEIRAFKQKLDSKLPSMSEFSVNFSEIIYTNANSKQKNLVRYILKKISKHYGFKYKSDFDDLTIEHILPQELIKTKGVREQVVGCLGNLIFIESDINGKLDTKPFVEKKKILVKEGYSLPLIVEQSASWGEQEILNRTNEMAEVAYTKIWKIS